MNESTDLAVARHVFFPDLDTSTSMATSAANLAREGFSVLPLHSAKNGYCTCGKNLCSSIGKHPLTPHGSKDATREVEKIRLYWEHYPLANVGIATGMDADLVVLDVDKKSGGLESLAQIEKAYGSLSENRQVQSGGGGRHFYFKAPKEKLKNKTGILPGIDFRGEGGYIVAPPSIHLSGLRYEWQNQEPLRNLPAWLFDIVKDPVISKSTVLSLDKIVTANLSPESAQIQEGSRNAVLASIAGFLKVKGFGAHEIEKILPLINAEGCHPPLLDLEVTKIAKSISRYESITWGPLLPLPAGSVKLEPLHPDHLPSFLQPWIVDVCQRMQVPLEFVAAPAIVAVSSIIGRKIAIKPLRNDDWTVIPNLWGMLVADPGSMKSAAMNQALRPLNALEKKSRSDFEKACQQEAIHQKDVTLEIEALKQSIKLDWSQGIGRQIENKKEEIKLLQAEECRTPLKEKRHKTNDPTIEKLAVILKDNPQGLLLLRDELSGWLESLAKSGREGSREFYLEAWNGNGSFSFDRIGRGSTFTESICLSIFGGIQPERLKKYFDRYENSHGQDGFIERFQLSMYPDPLPTWELLDKKPDQKAYDRVLDLFQKLDDLPMNESGSIIFEFSSEAQDLFYSWRKDLELRILNTDTKNLKKSYLSKYRSLMPSLALIFQVIQNSHDNKSVGVDAITMAIKWVRILEFHMEKIFNIGEGTPECCAKNLVEKIKSRDMFDGIKTREIQRKGWKGLRDPQKVLEVLTLLQKHGYIQIIKEGVGGQSSEFIRINPAVFSEGGAS